MASFRPIRRFSGFLSKGYEIEKKNGNFRRRSRIWIETMNYSSSFTRTSQKRKDNRTAYSYNPALIGVMWMQKNWVLSDLGVRDVIQPMDFCHLHSGIFPSCLFPFFFFRIVAHSGVIWQSFHAYIKKKW